MSDAMKKAVEGSDGGAAQRAQYEAEQAAEKARAAAVKVGYPRVMSSGGARDDLWVYPSEYTFSFDSKEDALAAIDKARAEGRHVSVVADNGDFVLEQGPTDWVAAIELDPSTRYSTSDHTGGR